MNVKRIVAFATMPLLLLGNSAATTLASYGGADHSYEADLAGQHEVPPVQSSAWGYFHIKFNHNNNTAHVEAEGEGLKDVTGAHLHCGWKGESGPIVADLIHASNYDVSKPQNTEKYHQVNFEIQDNDVKYNADCKDWGIYDLEDLAAAAAKGYIYVNVHTKKNPNGEIRGQLEKATYGDYDYKYDRKSDYHKCSNWPSTHCEHEDKYWEHKDHVKKYDYHQNSYNDNKDYTYKQNENHHDWKDDDDDEYEKYDNKSWDDNNYDDNKWSQDRWSQDRWTYRY